MQLKTASAACVLALVLTGAAVSVQAQPAPAVPAYVAAAVADPARPEADRKRDADRHPAEVVAFAGVKPGDVVVDVMPGGGYFTRIFAKAVGPTGRVIAYVPKEIENARFKPVDSAKKVAADYPNVRVEVDPATNHGAHNVVDVVWTSQNYHDLHDKFMGGIDVVEFDRAVFDALKPGGVFVIEDHAAAAGSGLSATETLHRIDPAAVRQEVEKAGFVYDGELTVLRNPADPHTANVFDPSIRGHTDQFVYRFRKPRS